MSGRTIHSRARCQHCPAPLDKRAGQWVHHWLYVGRCQTPEADPETIEEDYGR